LQGGNLKINVHKVMGTNNEHRALMLSLQCVRERRRREWTIGYIIHVCWWGQAPQYEYDRIWLWIANVVVMVRHRENSHEDFPTHVGYRNPIAGSPLGKRFFLRKKGPPLKN
jgi:hypothetical protein